MTGSAPLALEPYLESRFETPREIALPAADEGHVAWWRSVHSRQGGDASALVAVLPQLQLPVAKSASRSEAYTRAIRQGEPLEPAVPAEAIFTVPDAVSWQVVDHAAGGLPVIALEHRADFERAFRALGARCEPVAVGSNVHALYVSGLPNPVRLREVREAFVTAGGGPAEWPERMARARAADATAFHDRLVLLHPAPYAGIPAAAVGLDDAAWIEASTRLRVEHEFTHHATHRLLGSYRLHVHDEVLADLMGFTRALGRFEAQLFLHGLGIDGDRIRPDARLHAYVADLDPAELPRLVALLRRVAGVVESLAPEFVGVSEEERLRRMMDLAGRDLRELAGEAPA